MAKVGRRTTRKQEVAKTVRAKVDYPPSNDYMFFALGYAMFWMTPLTYLTGHKELWLVIVGMVLMGPFAVLYVYNYCFPPSKGLTLKQRKQLAMHRCIASYYPALIFSSTWFTSPTWKGGPELVLILNVIGFGIGLWSLNQIRELDKKKNPLEIPEEMLR